jgi:hypothetical protein
MWRIRPMLFSFFAQWGVWWIKFWGLVFGVDWRFRLEVTEKEDGK